jgi:hypothetical protein
MAKIDEIVSMNHPFGHWGAFCTYRFCLGCHQLELLFSNMIIIIIICTSTTPTHSFWRKLNSNGKSNDGQTEWSNPVPARYVYWYAILQYVFILYWPAIPKKFVNVPYRVSNIVDLPVEMDLVEALNELFLLEDASWWAYTGSTCMLRH